jgi:glutamate carboxypeptidase
LLHGPGTGDMKGGLVVMVYALKALKEVGMLHKLNLSLILNSDEEIGSISSYFIFLEERKKATACLVAECAGPNGEIVISRNGKLGARIECFGKDRHVSNGTHEKSSAILELAHKIISIESLNAYVPGVSINVGRIEGGLGPSTIAAQAHCLLDVRWEKEEHREILLNKIQSELSWSSQPGCHSVFKILNSRPVMPLNEANENLFRMVIQTAHQLGQEIKSEHRRGTSDANFFGSAGVPTLDGLGPISKNDHTADEFIKISSLKERSTLLALFILEYSRKTGMII